MKILEIVNCCAALSPMLCMSAYMFRCAPGFIGNPTIPGETCVRNNGMVVIVSLFKLSQSIVSFDISM